jgi:ATP-dependent Lon protease
MRGKVGKVLPVGGIQPKLLAAMEAGVKTVILPADNQPDVDNLADYMHNRVQIVYITDIQEVLAAALHS